MREAFAIVSAILICIGQPPYIIDTINGKTKPERMTWFIFSLSGIVVFVSQIDLGATWSLVFTGFETAVSIFTFGLPLVDLILPSFYIRGIYQSLVSQFLFLNILVDVVSWVLGKPWLNKFGDYSLKSTNLLITIVSSMPAVMLKS
jgi:hypothetical protein